MHAIITSPEKPGRLIVTDLPAPQPAPGVAIVRVHASSINRGETRLIPSRPNGWAPGQDLAGVVEFPALDGGPARGTRVVGLADGGSWSELVAVPVERLAPLPDSVSDEVAATLPAAGLTALRALRALGDVIGRAVLVTGVRGAAGNVAAQLARAAGADVTGLARTVYAFDGVRIVTALADGDRFDGVIDTVGGEVLAAALGHLTPHAKAVTFAGSTPAPIGLGTFAGVPASLEALYVYRAPGRFDDDLATLVRFVADGRLAPHIDRKVPIADVNAGLAALGAGGIDGKVVLVRSR
jgi:NADPH:quinone reductase-like Zn-dependent oxidoreductase